MTLESEGFVILTAHLRCGPICCPLSMDRVWPYHIESFVCESQIRLDLWDCFSSGQAHRDPQPCLWLRQALILCLEWWTDLLSDGKWTVWFSLYLKFCCVRARSGSSH